MIIAQISDTHILAKSSGEAVGARRAEDLGRCVADINRQGADVVIHTGDSVHGGLPEEYDHLRGILDALDAPYFPIPGNRDRPGALRAAFDDHPCLPANGDSLHYVIEDHPVRLVALDSVAAGERKGVFGTERQAWLEETLAREPERPTLLFIHHPPFDIGSHYVGGYRHAADAEGLEALVARHPQVKGLLCGHVHCRHRASWGGTVAATMPSVALDLRFGGDPGRDAAPSYVLHDVSADGGLVSRTREVAP